MTTLSRRSFLRRAALAGAAVRFSARSWGRVAGSNSDLRVAVVGLGCGPMNRGQVHLKYYRRIPGVRIVAICDVDSAVLRKVAADLARAGLHPDAVADVRTLLGRPDIDAISVATPNHWHALLGIWGCQVGKDVFLEKPVSHNIWEGRQLVRAAAKYGRIVQAGTQNRSCEAIAEAVAWVRAGGLGAIRRTRAVVYNRRRSIGKTTGPQPVPATVNYDLWLGPAPFEPPRRSRFHYDWHWFWHTGNGEIGNNGVHEMDVARWFMGDPALPPRILSVGGRLGFDDDGQTANTQVAVYDYAPAPMICEVRGFPSGSGSEKMDTLRGVAVGVVVECEHGYVVKAKRTEAFDWDGKRLKDFGTGGDFLDAHFRNFVACAREHRPDRLNCPISVGHVSTSLSHLGNISHRVGRAASPGEIRERVSGNPEMAAAFGRMAEHLARNGVDLDRTPATLGMPLRFDSRDERFMDNAAADALLTRPYRAPYTVPDEG